MVLTTPLLEWLAREGPVHVVATPIGASLLANHPAVASVIVYDKRRHDRGARGLWRVARALKATGATRAFMAQGSMRTAALARLAGISERVGFDTSAGRLLYSRRVRYDRSLHHAQRLLRLAGATHPARPTLFPSAADVAAVDALLTTHDVSPATPLIGLAPGSVWATKRWPAYAGLAATLTARSMQAPELFGARIVAIGGREDAPLAAAIDAAVRNAGGAPVIDSTGQLSLLSSAALIARCRYVVTNDSAPLHLASAMDTPTVAIFGPTVPAMGFGPLATRRAVAELPTLACRPCHAHGPMQCPLGHWQCMRALSPDAVADAALGLLAAPSSPLL